MYIQPEEAFEAAPELEERVAYHAALEARYRRAARYPWILAPTEQRFMPDDRIWPPEWLRLLVRIGASDERSETASGVERITCTTIGADRQGSCLIYGTERQRCSLG